MRVFLTGATGFIGSGIAKALRDRGDDVRALVRSPEKAKELEEAGVELVAGSLADGDSIRSAMEGCDAVIHNAAVYEVGIKKSERPAMYEANVVGTENVLGAALDAKVPKVVYVSTVGVFGNTKGEIVEEGYEHHGEYCSYYEETKVLAHKVAARLIGEGLPCVIVQPGGVYGFPPNFGELISASDGVTYWARHDKAVRYSPRPLEQGLRDLLAAEGKLPAEA